MEKVAETIGNRMPDIWYDIYAKIFPGSYFVCAFILILKPQIGDFHFSLLAGLIFAGYFLGHFMTTYTSLLAKFLQSWFLDASTVEKVRATLPRNSRDSLLISKKHAECSGYASALLFTLLLLLLNHKVDGNDTASLQTELTFIMSELLLYIGIFFFIGAIERAHNVAKAYKECVERIEYMEATEHTI